MSPDVLRPWTPQAGEWNRRTATHLYRRAGFGARPEEIDLALEAGFQDTLASIVAQDEHDQRLLQGVDPLLPREDIEPVAAWWMFLILRGGAPVRERVTLMWHDHFATSNAKVDDPRMMVRQNRLFREKGLGDFRELLHEVSRDPAMLVWLDGNANRRGHPNENFAREVLELFALGIGNYTEKDIQEAARAFTGWGTRGRSFELREEQHDPGTKTLFGASGAYGGDEAIDRILEHPACARHVAGRLLEEFVAPDPAPEWIDATARVLIEEEWRIGNTIEILLASELFFSPATRRSRIAAPVELVAGTIRALDAGVPAQKAAEACARMGQALFRPPSVKGWDGMRAWINAGTWVARHNAMSSLAFAHVGDGEGVTVDLHRSLREPTADGILRTLMPDLRDSAFASRLDRAIESERDPERALALGTALVLTSPEYQMA